MHEQIGVDDAGAWVGAHRGSAHGVTRVVEVRDGGGRIRREERRVPVEAACAQVRAEVLCEATKRGEFAAIDLPPEDGLRFRRECDAGGRGSALCCVEAKLDGGSWRDVAAALCARGEREAGDIGECAWELRQRCAKGCGEIVLLACAEQGAERADAGVIRLVDGEVGEDGREL